MNDKFFVDTNILVYAHDRSAGAKDDRLRTLIEQLWQSGNGVLSTQVLQELCFNLRRKANPPLQIVETRRLLQDYLSWEVVVNSPESVVQALEIEDRYKTSFLGCAHSSCSRSFRRSGFIFGRLLCKSEVWFGTRCESILIKKSAMRDV